MRHRLVAEPIIQTAPVRARVSTVHRPHIIYILCHTRQRYEQAIQIYRQYTWAVPLQMIYQDYTFENAAWKQILERKAEWSACHLVGAMSFRAFEKVDVKRIDHIMKTVGWSSVVVLLSGLGSATILNEHNVHPPTIYRSLIQYMLNGLGVPDHRCFYYNYFMCTPVLMELFIRWQTDIAVPLLMEHPDALANATYNGGVTAEDLVRLWGKPYYPMVPFILERLTFAFFQYDLFADRRLPRLFTPSVSIFLVNHNESPILRQTIAHYRSRLPGARITVCDNYSTDDSPSIARELGCTVITWGSPSAMQENELTQLKNSIWKAATTDWILMCDMDEWLCVTEHDLYVEELKHVTILQTIGYNIVGESAYSDLHDISLHTLKRGFLHTAESKALCFNKRYVTDMRYDHGAHRCSPMGKVQWSTSAYINKHMDALGAEYKVAKNRLRKARTAASWKFKIATHYNRTDEEVRADHAAAVATSVELSL